MILLGVLLDVGIVWWIFDVFDVMPDWLEETVRGIIHETF